MGFGKAESQGKSDFNRKRKAGKRNGFGQSSYPKQFDAKSFSKSTGEVKAGKALNRLNADEKDPL